MRAGNTKHGRRAAPSPRDWLDRGGGGGDFEKPYPDELEAGSALVLRIPDDVLGHHRSGDPGFVGQEHEGFCCLPVNGPVPADESRELLNARNDESFQRHALLFFPSGVDAKGRQGGVGRRGRHSAQLVRSPGAALHAPARGWAPQPTSSTSLPWTWPPAMTRWASAAWSRGNDCWMGTIRWRSSTRRSSIDSSRAWGRTNT